MLVFNLFPFDLISLEKYFDPVILRPDFPVTQPELDQRLLCPLILVLFTMTNSCKLVPRFKLRAFTTFSLMGKGHYVLYLCYLQVLGMA
jgi:hypothetical protein